MVSVVEVCAVAIHVFVFFCASGLYANVSFVSGFCARMCVVVISVSGFCDSGLRVRGLGDRDLCAIGFNNPA